MCDDGLYQKRYKMEMHGRHVLTSSLSFTVDRKPCVITTESPPVVPPPPPISCSLGSWGEWSPCSTTGNRGARSRSRKVTQPALYGGTPCPDDIYEVDDTCTGMSDCGDESNAGTCEDPMQPWCKTNYPVIPNIAITSSGYDIIKNENVGNVLDNDNFCGDCDTVYLGEFQKSFRRPYNIQSFRSSTDVHTSLQVETYQNSLELSETKNSYYSNKFSIGVSYTYRAMVKFGSNAARTEESNWKSTIESSTSMDAMYFTVTSQVEIGKFQMNRRDLMLASEFRNRIAELPTHYDFAAYSVFLSDFGTHYYSRGTLGGKFDIIFEYSRSTLEDFELTEDEQANCLKTEMSMSIFGVGGASISNERCSSTGSSESEKKTFAQSATWSDGVVHGGSSSTGMALTLSGSKVDSTKYQAWAESIKHNPAIIDFELAPISHLVDNPSKRSNVEHALADLFGAYDPKKCNRGSCKNGGHFVVFDYGKSCTCVCPTGFYGVTCANSQK